MKGSLLRAEAHRFRSRRFVVVLLLLALAGMLTLLAISSTQFAKPSEATLQQARERISQIVTEQEGFRAQCLSNPLPGQSEQSCPPPVTASEFRVEDFVDKRPFVLATAGPDGSRGVAGAFAAVLFLIGATWVGAEWSTKSMVALLFWEPRRVRVILTKLGVLIGAAAAVAVAAQAIWLGAAHLLANARGTTSGLPEGFYGDLLAVQGRGVVLGLVGAALGFALANLVRNTGAALGIGFVYFVVVENATRALRPSWQEWLLTNNAAALMSDGGSRIFLQDTFVDDRGVLQNSREIVLSNLHGGVVLVAASAALVALGVVLFARRDLQ